MPVCCQNSEVESNPYETVQQISTEKVTSECEAMKTLECSQTHFSSSSSRCDMGPDFSCMKLGLGTIYCTDTLMFIFTYVILQTRAICFCYS